VTAENLNDEVNQFMFQHCLSMEIRNQKRDIVPLNPSNVKVLLAYRHRLPSQNDKVLCPSSEEPCQFVSENPLNVVSLFDLDADAD
jgi:hypothetical protein